MGTPVHSTTFSCFEPRKHHGIHPFTLMKHAHDILNLALPRWARPDSDIRADEFPDGHASINGDTEVPKARTFIMFPWPEMPSAETFIIF